MIVDEDRGWEILDALVPHILKNCEGCIVEIGMGDSTVLLAKHGKACGRPFYSCDKQRKSKPRYGEHWIYQMPSLDFIARFKKQPVAVAFLDGCKEYDVVIQEVEFFLPLLSPGGVMFLHDTWPPNKPKFLQIGWCGEMYLIRQNLEGRTDLQCFT